MSHSTGTDVNFLSALSCPARRGLDEAFPASGALRRSGRTRFWPYSLLLPSAFSRLSRQPSAEAAAPSADASFSFSRASLRFSGHTHRPSEVAGRSRKVKGQTAGERHCSGI